MFFQLSPINVRKKTIIFQLFDNDTFGADGIGEVQVPLWQISSLEAGVEETMELTPITKDKNKKPILAVKRPPDTQSARSSVSSIADGSFQRKSQSYAHDVQGGALVSYYRVLK